MPSTEAYIVLLAGKPTASVEHGFLPAAAELGLKVVLLTDRPHAYREALQAVPAEHRPGQLVECDLASPAAVIDSILALEGRPAAIFSNSDHLQMVTAITAAYFGLPGKDWRAAHRCKNKAAMRRHLAEQGIDALWFMTARAMAHIAAQKAIPFPCVAKPREGVASENVRLLHDRDELVSFCEGFWRDQPRASLLIEEFIAGELHTLETLGDGQDLHVLGGFACRLTPPPSFVVTEMLWRHSVDATDAVVKQLKALGVDFGVCHTEFVMTGAGPRLIEVNYRMIGDGADFLLGDVLGYSPHKAVLQTHLGLRLGSRPAQARGGAIRYRFTDDPPVPSDMTRDDCTVRFQPLIAETFTPGQILSNRHYSGRYVITAPDEDRVEAFLSRLTPSHQEIIA
jgi:biotin carboxylase